MTGKMRVAILIPVFNRQAYVIEAIDSALNQDTHIEYEIVVGDNDSTDDTWLNICQRYGGNSKVKSFRNERNLGPIENWRKCLAKTEAPWIRFLFSDDLIEKDNISILMSALDRNPGAAGAFSPVKMFTDGENSICKKAVYEIRGNGEKLGIEEVLYEYLMEDGSLPVSPGCGIFKRQIVEKALSWDPSEEHAIKTLALGYGPDLLMFAIAALEGGVVPTLGTYSFFRKHEDSISIREGYETSFWGYRYPILDLPLIVSFSDSQKRTLKSILDLSVLRSTLSQRSVTRELLAERYKDWRNDPVDGILRTTEFLRQLAKYSARTAKKKISKRG